MSKQLLTGNESIALGAHLASVGVVAGYPGTPSTEIIESMVQADYPNLYAEWAPNEKVALEVAIGASLSGVRSMACMKHVGVNVAADPLMTVTYMGVKGGLVIITADDPGMHSSQNEQDNRNYARFAKVPMLEPSDSQEACDMVAKAFNISEEYDTPVFLRSTTRISHSKGVVKAGDRSATKVEPGFSPDPQKLVMIPAHARKRHPEVLKRLEKLQKLAEIAHNNPPKLNRVEWRDRSIGVVTGGIAYQYVREALPDASVFKLGLSYPLPIGQIKSFAGQVEQLYVVEELDPFWETEIRAAGLSVIGKDRLPSAGELTPDIVRSAILDGQESSSGQQKAQKGAVQDIPARPPMLCPGCPHRGVFWALSRAGVNVTGDIGCYTLGVMPPLSAIDTTTCMGASIGHALGIKKALGDDAPDTVAVIGDSTFMHSGMTGLADVVYNQGDVTTIILDNRTTAMTGHQGNPSSGYNARLKKAPRTDFVKLARGMGVEDVHRVDPYDLQETARVIKEAEEFPGPSVVIADRPCILLDRDSQRAPFEVTEECTGCGFCLNLGCPALYRTGEEKNAPVAINPVTCTGCGMCAEVCGFSAIGEGDDSQ